MTESDAHTIVVMGAGAVGKSAITIRMVVNEFKQEYDATIEDSYSCKIDVDGQTESLDILDTAGQEQFKALRHQWILEANAFVLVYSVNSKTTFHAAIETYKTICRQREDMRLDLVLLANKIDLAESQHEVTYEQGKELADKWNVPFFETSARTGKKVTEAFHRLIRELRKEKEGSTYVFDEKEDANE